MQSKEATQAMQQWGAKEAEVILRKMLDSTGINPIPVDKSFSAMSGSTSEAASPGSALGSSLNPVPRRLSFASRQKSFAKGEQWPNLPGAALNYCKVGFLIVIALQFSLPDRKKHVAPETWVSSKQPVSSSYLVSSYSEN